MNATDCKFIFYNDYHIKVPEFWKMTFTNYIFLPLGGDDQRLGCKCIFTNIFLQKPNKWLTKSLFPAYLFHSVTGDDQYYRQ